MNPSVFLAGYCLALGHRLSECCLKCRAVACALRFEPVVVGFSARAGEDNGLCVCVPDFLRTLFFLRLALLFEFSFVFGADCSHALVVTLDSVVDGVGSSHDDMPLFICIFVPVLKLVL